jgi:hypothetical protein
MVHQAMVKGKLLSVKENQRDPSATPPSTRVLSPGDGHQIAQADRAHYPAEEQHIGIYTLTHFPVRLDIMIYLENLYSPMVPNLLLPTFTTQIHTYQHITLATMHLWTNNLAPHVVCSNYC